MRIHMLVLLTMVGCGRIASTESEKAGSRPQDPGSSTAAPPDNPGGPAPPPDLAPPPGPTQAPPPPAGTCGASVSARSFATAEAQAVALHGLWVGCTSDPAPGLCPTPDSSMFFGALDAQSDLASRATACGHLSSHGDGFIANAAYTFRYEVKDVAPSGSPPTYALRVWNDTADRTFVLTYRDDQVMTGSSTDGTITLGEPDGRVGTLRQSAFTTF